MAFRTRSTGRLVAMLATLAIALQAAASDCDEERKKPKVEYVLVAWETCLQPAVHDDDVELQDFREAALEWLIQAYPGCSTVAWRTEFILPPDGADDRSAKPTEYTRETVVVRKVDGTVVAECFRIDHEVRD